MTYRDIYDELLQTAERQHTHRRIQRRRNAAARQLEDEKQTLAACEQQLASEEKDVAKLEGRTLTALVVTILGRREERLTREREEAELARARYETQRVAVEQLAAQLAEEEQKLEALGDVDGAYQRAFAKKAQALVDDGGEAGKLVEALSQELVGVRAKVRETDEARTAGWAVLRHVQAARAGIPEEDTTTVLMPIGTMMMPMVTENELESGVERHLREAQRCGFRFARELGDLEPWVENRASILSTTAVLRGYVDDLFLSGKVLAQTRGATAKLEHETQALLRWLDKVLATARAHRDEVERAYVARVTHA